MKQFLLLRGFLAVAAFCFGAVAAHADVLEIGANGAQWVAGGPPRAMSTFSADKNQANAALTSGTPSLAPREWQGHLAAIAARHDISPALLEAVVWQESRWRPGAGWPPPFIGPRRGSTETQRTRTNFWARWPRMSAA